MTVSFTAPDYQSGNQYYPDTISSGHKAVISFRLASGTYVRIKASANKYAYYSKDKYLLWGKSGAYILLPAIEGKSLTSVTILTGKNASTSVKVGVYKADGSAAVKGGEEITLNAKDSEFSWSLSETTPNTKYQLRVCSKHNAQFQKLTLKYQ